MCARFCTSLCEIESCRHCFQKCGPYLLLTSDDQTTIAPPVDTDENERHDSSDERCHVDHSEQLTRVVGGYVSAEQRSDDDRDI